MTRTTALFAALFSVLGIAAALGDQQTLKNGSMESGGGPNSIDPQVPANWTEAGVNIERSAQYNFAPPSGGFSLKAFGDGQSTSVSASQEILNVSPGQSVTASVMLFSPSNDRLRGSGEAGLVIEFLGQFSNLLSSQDTYVLNVNSPADTWIPANLGPLTAPANTAKIRITCRLRWNLGDILGAAWWDDAQVHVNGGPNRVVNGDFETAGHSPGQSTVGIDNWLGFNDQEKSSVVAQNGTSSLQLGVRDQYSGLYQNMTSLSGGDRVFLFGRVWVPAADAPNWSSWRAGLKLEFQANGDVPPPIENLAFDQTTQSDVWLPASISTTVPPLATIARIVCIYVGDSSSGGEGHFDEVDAERSSQPGVNQLLNESFEFGPGGGNGIDNWTEFFGSNSECQKSCADIVPPLDGFCTARATGQSVAGVYQEIPVTPGENLTATLHFRQPSGNPMTGSGTRAGIKIEWVLGSVPPPVDIGAPNASTNTIGPGAATNTWIPLYIDFTMPPGTNATTRFVCIIEKGTSQTGHVYFDSCEAVVLTRFNGSDVDADNDEDMIDFAALQSVFRPGVTPPLWPGLVFDRNDDNMIDIQDWNNFLPNFTGPGN